MEKGPKNICTKKLQDLCGNFITLKKNELNDTPVFIFIQVDLFMCSALASDTILLK
jgi:hypothetical protein